MTRLAASMVNAETAIGTRQKRAVDKRFATRLLKLLVVTILVLLAAHLLLQYLNLVVFSEQNGQVFELSNRFDFDDESSVPTWFSQTLFLAIGVSALLAGYLQTDKSRRRLWYVIGVIGVLVSFDEAISIHEFVLQSLHVLLFGDSAPELFANAWWFVLPFVLVAAGWLFYRVTRLFPKQTVWLFVVGGIAFLAGAVGVDLFVISIPKETFLNQGILVAVEETLEIAGGIIILYAIVSYLETYHADVLQKAAVELKAGKKTKSL